MAPSRAGLNCSSLRRHLGQATRVVEAQTAIPDGFLLAPTTDVERDPLTARLLEPLKSIRYLRGPRALYTDEGETLTPKILERWIKCAERKAGPPETGRNHARHSSLTVSAGLPAPEPECDRGGHRDA